MTLAAPTRPHLHELASPEDQAKNLAQVVADQLRKAISENGSAVLAVSGGRSPIAFFEYLRRQALSWKQVQVVMVDERCVPPMHPDRNAQLIRRHLLQAPAADAVFIDWLSGIEAPEEHTPSALVKNARAQCPSEPWVVDVAVLGMGEDGHTASWFAASEGLDEALQSDEPLAWVRPQAAPYLRLTLTLSAIRRCRYVHLAIAGEVKLGVLKAALAGTTPDKPVQNLIAAVPALQIWVAN